MKGLGGNHKLLHWLINRLEVREAEIPSEVQALADEKRQKLIETLADVDDVIADRYLMEENPTIDELNVLSLEFRLT